MATKTATVNVYEMYGTRGEYAADILYRGKLLKQFAGHVSARDFP
jgi:hypothetical protein